MTRGKVSLMKLNHMKSELVFPMAFYVLIMWLSAVHMFRTRVRAIRSGQIPSKYYKAHIGGTPSENVVVVGRHYDNQFQVPILFFITCLVHMQIGLVNSTTIFLAWTFVCSRAVHSWVLLGRNILQIRAAVFGAGWLVILALWVQLIFLLKSES